MLCGAGALHYAALATAFVIVANLVLRPLVQGINRQPATSSGGLHLRSLDSANIEGSDRVEVNAVLSAQVRSDGAVEQIVGRLGLEPAVTGARWSVEALAD